MLVMGEAVSAWAQGLRKLSHSQGVISKREARASGNLAGTLIPKLPNRGTAESTAIALAT